VNFSEMPIMFVNLSGDFDMIKLKEYADDAKDKLENLSQITRVDIIGAPEREFQINVDNMKMQSANITFDDIANAVARENADISGGLLEVGNMKRTLQVKGQFKSAFDLMQIVVRNTSSAPIYLKDIADIRDTVKESESYARLDGKNVVTLSVIKRAGENLIETSDGVKRIVDEMKEDGSLPPQLNVVITGDQSKIFFKRDKEKGTRDNVGADGSLPTLGKGTRDNVGADGSLPTLGRLPSAPTLSLFLLIYRLPFIQSLESFGDHQVARL